VTFSVELLKKKEALAPFIKAFDAEEILFHQGQLGQSLFVILKGRVHLLLDSELGEHVFSVAAPGDLLGEKALLSNVQYLRVFSAQAAEPVIAIELSYSDLIQLQKNDPEFILDVLKRSFEISAKRLEQSNYLCRILKGNNAKKRFLDCILYVAQFTGAPADKEIRIPTLIQSLDYNLELDPSTRDALIQKLIQAGALRVQNDGVCYLTVEKMLTLSDAK
jgi:CRP-like cAMP-binding protein